MRRDWKWWVSMVVAAAGTAALHAAPSTAPPLAAKRPNMVVLVADDWGFTDLGAFGGEISTPNLDALARRGVRFSNFHVAASCSPTRSMLLTGVDNHRNGVGNLLEAMPGEHRGRPGYQGSLNKNVVTVASLLQDSGYRTYITGKWNVGSEPYNLPNQRGFDRSIVQGDTGSDNWVPSQRYLPHSAKVEWFEDGKEAVMPAEFYSSEFFVSRAIDYIQSDARKTQPFFAYIGFQANHVPLQAPKSFVDKYKGRYQDGWTALREARARKATDLGMFAKQPGMVALNTTQDWQALNPAERAHMEREMEVYAGMAEAMDFHVGRLVETLRQSGELENTVFVFLSDNGPEGSDYAEAQLWLRTQYTQDTDKLGGKGAYGVAGPSWASASASPLSTYKFYAGEGGIRTPMFIAGPPVAKPALISHSLTHVTDIAPTLLDIAGVKAPVGLYRGSPVERIAGRSLLPVLTGNAQGVRGPEDALGYELSGNLALFKGNFKLTKNMPPLGDGQWHLFDLSADPGETTDLQATHPELFMALQTEYAHYAQDHGVLPMPAGYSPQRQVMINSFTNYWWPAYGSAMVATLVGLGLLLATWLYRRNWSGSVAR
jgi:arylsulfatase A-like enzyme